MNLKYKIGASLATGALLASVFAPAALAADLEISGNGAGSTNGINVNNSNSTNVGQTNIMNVETNVVSVAKTGENKANGNTGGDVKIETGNANSTVSVSVVGGKNEAKVNPCACETTPQDVLIKGNGDHSSNGVSQDNSKGTSVGQTSLLGVNTDIVSIAKTGKNKAKWNTGGKTTINTGHSTSTVSVGVTGPSNTLNP